MHPDAQKVQQAFPEVVQNAVEWRGDLTIHVKRERLHGVCRYLHDDPGLDYDYIVHVSSVDWPDHPERFEVVYEFYSIRRKQRRSEEHTSELQSRPHLVCRLLLEK